MSNVGKRKLGKGNYGARDQKGIERDPKRSILRSKRGLLEDSGNAVLYFYLV